MSVKTHLALFHVDHRNLGAVREKQLGEFHFRKFRDRDNTAVGEGDGCRGFEGRLDAVLLLDLGIYAERLPLGLAAFLECHVTDN